MFFRASADTSCFFSWPPGRRVMYCFFFSRSASQGDMYGFFSRSSQPGRRVLFFFSRAPPCLCWLGDVYCFFSKAIANVLRTEDPQALRRPRGRDSQPCGRDSWPILGGVEGGVDKPEHPIEAHCGPIETPAAAGLPKNDRACGILGDKKNWRQEVENMKVFRARSARKSENFRARSARKQRKTKLFRLYF